MTKVYCVNVKCVTNGHTVETQVMYNRDKKATLELVASLTEEYSDYHIISFSAEEFTLKDTVDTELASKLVYNLLPVSVGAFNLMNGGTTNE